MTLLDRQNHHLFQPLLYQVAMAGLAPAEVAVPIRSVLSRQENVRVLLANVTHVDLAQRTVTSTEAAPLEYDGEVNTAANLFDALKEGYYGKY